MPPTADVIFGIIEKEASVDRAKIRLDATLEELDVESLDVVQVIFAIEDHFDIRLPENDPAFDTRTVGGLVSAVDRLVAAKAQGGAA